MLGFKIVELLLKTPMISLILFRIGDGSISIGHKPWASFLSRVLVIFRLAGMMISPVWLLTTSSGIFFTQQDVGERLGQLLEEFFLLGLKPSSTSF